MRGYETEYEQLEPAWPTITIAEKVRHDDSVRQRLLGVTSAGNVVPMELICHWDIARMLVSSGEPNDLNFNRLVIALEYVDGSVAAIQVIRVLEDLARGAGLPVDAWEPDRRPRQLPYAWRHTVGAGTDKWVLREE